MEPSASSEVLRRPAAGIKTKRPGQTLRRRSIAATVVGIGLLLSACGGGAGAPQQPPAPSPTTAPAAAAPSPAKKLQKATLRLDWTLFGYHAPFYLGLQNGYYKDEGIDLTVAAGNGSSTVAQAIGNGTDTFGFVDAGTMMALVAKGLKVKMIMGVFQKSPNAFVFPASAGIKKPSDLVGRRVAFTPGEAPYILLPAFLKANGMQLSQLKMVAVSPQNKPSAMLSGKVDATLDFDFANIPPFEAKSGKKYSSLNFADYGVNVPGLGIIAADSTLQEHPDLVRSFLKATVRSWQSAQQDPGAAIDAMVKANPGQQFDKSVQQQILSLSFRLLSTKNTAGHPLGWMSNKDWSQAQDLLVKYQHIQPQGDIGAYFTNQYLPGS